MTYRNRSKLYKKGRVFVNKKTGRLVKIIEYYPQTSSTPQKVVFVNIDHETKKGEGNGECFGNIENYLYNINQEIDVYLPEEQNENIYKAKKIFPEYQRYERRRNFDKQC